MLKIWAGIDFPNHVIIFLFNQLGGVDDLLIYQEIKLVIKLQISETLDNPDDFHQLGVPDTLVCYFPVALSLVKLLALGTTIYDTDGRNLNWMAFAFLAPFFRLLWGLLLITWFYEDAYEKRTLIRRFMK